MGVVDVGLGVVIFVELWCEWCMVCVEYLGVVCDVFKMLLILGGEEGVFWVRSCWDYVRRVSCGIVVGEVGLFGVVWFFW